MSIGKIKNDANPSNECQPLIRKDVIACNLGAPSGPSISITTLIDIINNFFLNQCAEFPLQINPGTCIEIAPGFCGSILQHINGAWGIYRSPGMTEITVGNTAAPPGANFPDVASALGQSLNTNCRFIRITDNTTDGALNLPANTLVYIDPGVTWTVTGPITLNGDFVLLGNQPNPSSTVSFGGQGAGALIQGVGSLMVRDLHIIHAPQAGPGEIFVDPTIQSRFIDTVVSLGDNSTAFLDDTTAAFVSISLDHVTLIGGGANCNNAIIVSRANSIFSSNMLIIQEVFDPVVTVINAPNPTVTWQGIRLDQASNILLELGGTITDVHQIGLVGNVTLRVVPFSTVSQIIVDILVLQGNCRVSNFRIRTLDVTGIAALVPYHLDNGLVTVNFVNNDLRLTTGTQISNVTYEGVNSLNTNPNTNIARNSTISNFIMTNATANLTLQLTEFAAAPFVPPPKRIQISNLQVNGNLTVDMYIDFAATQFMNVDSITDIANAYVGGNCTIWVRTGVGVPNTGCYINNVKIGGNLVFNNRNGTDPIFRGDSLFANNITILGNMTIGNPVAGLATGSAILSNMNIAGTTTVLLDYDAAHCTLTNFISGPMTWNRVQFGNISDGVIFGDFNYGDPGFSALQSASNLHVTGVTTISTSTSTICNLHCNIVNITGGGNTLSQLTNLYSVRVGRVNAQVTISGASNNFLNSTFNGSVIVNNTARGTMLGDLNIQGSPQSNNPQDAYGITNASWLAGVATFTTNPAPFFAVGTPIVVTGLVPVGYNGSFVVTGLVPAGPGPYTGFTVTMAVNPGPFVSGGLGAVSQRFIIDADYVNISNVILGNPFFINNPPSISFAEGGFGNNVTGQYTIRLGNNAGTNNNIHIDNFSVYPRTGQPSINISGSAATAGTIAFNASYSNYNNVRVWFFPGGIFSTAPATLLNASTNTIVTVGIPDQVMRSGFSNWRIGYGNEAGLAAPVNIGLLDIFATDITLANILSNNIRTNIVTIPALQSFSNCHCLDPAVPSTFAATTTATLIITGCRNFTTIPGYGGTVAANT